MLEAVYVWQSQPSQALSDAAAWACTRFAKVNALVREGARETTIEPSLRALCGDKLEVSFRPASLEEGLCAQVSKYSSVQIDYDAVPSQLRSYRRWLDDLKACAAKTRITFTALPSWLASAHFPPLARAHPHYTLQVHSIQTSDRGQRTLYDSTKARAAVAKASALGVPFHVALPTYRYDGITADWTAIAADVRHWNVERPAQLLGVYWFRLPIEGDAYSLPRDVFEKLTRGEAPPPEKPLRFVVRPAKNGLVDILVKNDGVEPKPMPRWQAHWPRGESPLASETFQVPRALISPGEERLVGWLRFARPTEVTILAQDDSRSNDARAPAR